MISESIMDLVVTGNSSTSPPTNATETSTGWSHFSERDKLYMEIEGFLRLYYAAFLVAIGTVFNVLSILILRRAAFRRTTTSVYLRFLACIDMFVLYNGLSRHFVSQISGYNIRHLSESFCKFNQWSSSFGPDVSAWILVAVTTERVISTVWPHKVKAMCSKTIATIVVIAISLVIVASNIPLLVFYGDIEVVDHSRNITSVEKCVPVRKDYAQFLDDIWYWIDLIKFLLLPSVILTLFNIIIINVVIQSRRRLEKNGSLSRTSRKQTTSFSGCQNATAAVRADAGEGNTNTAIQHGRQVSIANKEISLTITLVVVNATFVTCNSPVMLYLLGAPYWFPAQPTPAQNLTFVAAVMAMYTNNAVNFLLYCATGSRFRAEVRSFFSSTCRTRKNLQNGSSAYNSRDSSGGKSAAAKQHLDDHLATVVGSLETCCSHLSGS